MSTRTITNFIEAHGLRPGDAIVVYKSNIRQAKHYFMLLDNNEFIQNSVNKNINRPSHTEVAEMLKDFIKVERFTGNEYQRQQAIERALEIEYEGRKYWLALYNCEDFVQEAWTGAPTSKQVDALASFGVIAGLVLALIGISKNSKPLAVGGAIVGCICLIVLLTRDSSSKKRSINYNYKRY